MNNEVNDIIEAISMLIKDNKHIVNVTLETIKGTKIHISTKDHKLYEGV